MNYTTGGSTLVLDVYKCCSCLKVPEGQIFCCKKCHPICINCYGNTINRCPKCHDELPVENKIRNEHLEETLDEMEFDCEFSGDGCKEKLPRQMLSRHFKTCRYREKSDLQSNIVSSGYPSSAPVATSVVVKQEEISSALLSCQGSSRTSDKSSMPVIEMNKVEVEDEDEDDCQIVDAERHIGSMKPEEIILYDEDLYSSEDDCRIVVDAEGHIAIEPEEIRLSDDDDFDTSVENNLTINVETLSSSQCGMQRKSQESFGDGKGQKETTASTGDGGKDGIEGGTLGVTSNEENDTANSEAASSSISRFSRKRTISETEYQNDAEGANRAELKDEVFDTFSFSSEHILKMIEEPKLMEQYTKCKIAFSDKMSSNKILKVLELFRESGDEFLELFVSIPFLEESFRFLEQVLQTVPNTEKLIYEYQHGQDALQFLNTLKVCKDKGKFPYLTSLKLVGASGKESLTNDHITQLSEVRIKFQNLEIGDSLWEDVKPATVRKLMENCKDSLERLIINGGFQGRRDKTQIVLTFPKMEVLHTFWLCPHYSFLSEFNNPQCKKSRIVEPDGEQEEPIKVTVKFQDSFPNLKGLAFGNLVEVEDLYFSTIRKLTAYECGSLWNLSVQFPPESSRKTLFQSNVIDFQFPDNLKDPSFPEKVGKHFPILKIVSLNLPSVAVLQAFFKAFQNSSVEELYLKTQFDFPSLLESCLFPEITAVVQDQDEESKALIKTLKEYQHFEEYASYYNFELPSEQMKDKSEGISAGIAGLKNLKVLRLEHVPRNILIPVVDEEKKWFDHRCKFMNTTLGFCNYPLTYECQQEILKLNLEEYYPIRMMCKLTGKLNKGINENVQESSKANEEFFNFEKNNLRSSAQVKIEHSLGLLNSDVKSE